MTTERKYSLFKLICTIYAWSDLTEVQAKALKPKHREKEKLPVMNKSWIENGAIAKIINGTEVEGPDKYPYMAFTFGSVLCGASLVGRNVLLSAAHCVQGGLQYASIGRSDNGEINEEYETFEIIEQIMHPGYNEETLDYDYAMLRLDRSSIHKPVSLDNGAIIITNETDLITMGWGHTSTGGSISEHLLETELDAWEEKFCEDFFDYYSWTISDRMMCASRPGYGSCQGDSGGPLVDKKSGVQVGIVSYGFGDCANPDFPGIYARVSDQIDWIQGYINCWSNDTTSTACSQQPPNPPTQSISPSTNPTCSDLPNFVDAIGDTCDFYTQSGYSGYGCREHGEDSGTCCGSQRNITPNKACCACGGGNNRNHPTISPGMTQFPTEPYPTDFPSISPTITPTSSLPSIHIGAISSIINTALSGKTWNLRIPIKIVDAFGSPVAKAKVKASYFVEGFGNNNGSKIRQCRTRGTGKCTIKIPNFQHDVYSVHFTILDIVHGELSYNPRKNIALSNDQTGCPIFSHNCEFIYQMSPLSNGCMFHSLPTL